MKKFAIFLAVIMALLLLSAGGLTAWLLLRPEASAPPVTEPSQVQTPVESEPSQPSEPPTQPSEPENTTEPDVSEETEPPTEPPFTPAPVEDTDPAAHDVSWDVIIDGQVVEEYVREEPISFDDEYFALPGISTFRGGNYRQDASYGTADIQTATITQLWSKYIGALDPDWSGCGWTGQPQVVQWDKNTRQLMNLYEDKKNKDGLVEVIYTKMDGYVHFFDIEDGSPTRDPLYVGMVFKGSGAIDPRGYPILYVGSGIVQGNKYQTMFAISLIDGAILHEWSGYSSMSNRWWFAFDGAPLIDGETDTLIWAGESGLLYTIKLNTRYDNIAGTISMEPDSPVISRYRDKYTNQGRWPGYEASVTAAKNYLFLGDNAGMFQCIDVNTMEVVWAQDLKDDVNATAVFEWGDDGNGYLYTAPSTDYVPSHAGLPITKMDAQTGEVIWSYSVDCVNVTDLPGGALASPLLGRAGTDIENLIIFSIGRSPNAYAGQVMALDKETGELVWQFETDNYMWSSPVAVYSDEGKSYIFQCDASGNCYLLDGLTGQQVSYLYLGSTVESSPIVYEDRIVLGTRSGICLFKIS